jgi:hypothetical protein
LVEPGLAIATLTPCFYYSRATRIEGVKPAQLLPMFRA